MTKVSQHILLVEDDPAIATSLKVTFKRENWQLTWLDNVSAVLPKLYEMHQTNMAATPLSAIILDVGLPDGDGLQLCQSIRSSEDIGDIKDLPILFLTARSDEVDRILGLEMGADDYCPKPFSPRELVARIKAIWRRQTHFNPHLNSHVQRNTHSQVNVTSDLTGDEALAPIVFALPSGEWQYQPQSYRLSWQGHKLELSNTERKLLLFLLQNATQVFSREQLLSAISNHPDHRLARTIDSHVKAIRKQLAKIHPELEVIYTHRGIGYGLCCP